MALSPYYALKLKIKNNPASVNKGVVKKFVDDLPVYLSDTAGECTAPGTTYTNQAECTAAHADVFSGRVGVWRHGNYGHIVNGVFVPDDPNAQTLASKNMAIHNAALGIQGDGSKMPGDENVQNPFERFALLGVVAVIGVMLLWRMK